MADPLSPGDPSSFSRPEDCVVTDIHLDVQVDFKTEIVGGHVVLKFEKCHGGVEEVLLDTRDLSITKVTDHGSGRDLPYKLHSPTLSFGSQLQIQLGAIQEKTGSVRIDYETSPKCTALQWLRPEQTAGKKHPYMFSQCQVSAPGELEALMSAVKKGTSMDCKNASQNIHHFEQKVPIPSYLIAIVVGPLWHKRIGPRSHVWTEECQLEAAAHEFAETEEMLTAAENLLGPYVWGVYDLLVLPPSFPYGGMENPCLTFVTPTLLAGDRSLALVVAHEIAHSWTGNLVTNSNPEHFWLNEGHTVFVERKIAGRLKDEAFRHFEAIGGWKELQYQVDVFGAEHPYTHLVPKLTGVDPDDAFSTVPYEKGSSLLMHLEQLLGGPDVFEPFLRAYIEKFKFKSINTRDWKNFLYQHFEDKREVLDSVDWNAWFHKPGMPPVKPKFDTSLADSCNALAARWVAAPDDQLDQFQYADISEMNAYLVREVLANLLEEEPLSAKKIERMGKEYGLNNNKNSEIRLRWLRLCLKSKVQAAIQEALEFVNEQGRMKFVRPLYRDLYNWESARETAIENFKKQKPFMHNLTASMLEKDLKLA